MVLMLTESAGCNEFQRIRSRATEQDNLGDWLPRLTREACSLIIRHVSGEEIIVIAGRQIVTREKLEVLALASDVAYPDGEPIQVSLTQAAHDGAIIVLPWGFGKWLGERGRIIRQLLEDDNAPKFYLGDNGGRLRYGPAPKEFSTAEKKRIRVLPGTDPLPFRSEVRSIGRYGFSLNTSICLESPAAELNTLLADTATVVKSFGHGEGILRFLRNQAMMQITKRFRSSQQSLTRASNSPN
jgi:hypothetical protein